MTGNDGRVLGTMSIFFCFHDSSRLEQKAKTLLSMLIEVLLLGFAFPSWIPCAGILIEACAQGAFPV